MADDFLCLEEVEKVIHLPLPLTYIGNEKAGVLEILESWKRQYDHQLEGIIISYKNLSLLSQNAIVMEKYCVQICVKAKFNLFRPVVGCIVKGKINRISKEHIGCLVHDTINVAIKLREYYPTELNKFLRLEQDILFEIANFCFQLTEIRIKGKITPECLRLMNDLFPVIEEEEITNYSFQSLNSVTQYDFNDTEFNLMDVKQEKITSSSSSDLEDKQRKPKKVKSKKLRSPENVFSEFFSKKEENNLLNVHSNGIETSKSGKKRKRESTDGETSTNSSQKQDSDVDNLTQLSNEIKTKKPKLDLPSPQNHAIKKKKRKKEKGDKKKSHKSKKNNVKTKKKGKTVASGEVLKKDKKKHKSKHLSKDNTHKLESKSSKKHSKKKKSKHTNDVLNDVTLNSITQYDFNDKEFNLMDIKQEKITSSSSSDLEDKHKKVKSKKLRSPEKSEH